MCRSWCIVIRVTRITVDVNDEWLEAAREILGTDTKVATINEALHKFALQKKAAEIMAALDSAEMDFTGSERAWRYGGGRDLTRLEEKAREGDTREDHVA
jgi:Arc/MetJ family transcription regulator